MDNETELLLDNLPENIAMITKVWGPPAWHFLHSMAMAYPKRINENNNEHVRIKNSMHNFLINLGNVLPCGVCSVSYNQYIHKEPQFNPANYLHSRKSLVYFMYLLHDKVNEKLGVPKCQRHSLTEVVKFYSKFVANKPCRATTEQEKADKKKQGCKKKDFSDYKCSVKILDKSDNKYEAIHGKENFGNDSNGINLCLLVLLIIALIVIGVLVFKK